MRNEFAAEREALVENQQQEVEKEAARREKLAVTAALRKIVVRLTGIEPS